MYHPYLRGKQYELILLRENAKLIKGDKFQCVLTYRNEIIQLGIFEDAREAAIVRDMEIINRNFPNTLNFKYEGITNVY